MNTQDKVNKKINACARHIAIHRGEKEQEEMDKKTEQKRLF